MFSIFTLGFGIRNLLVKATENPTPIHLCKNEELLIHVFEKSKVTVSSGNAVYRSSKGTSFFRLSFSFPPPPHLLVSFSSLFSLFSKRQDSHQQFEAYILSTKLKQWKQYFYPSGSRDKSQNWMSLACLGSHAHLSMTNWTVGECSDWLSLGCTPNPSHGLIPALHKPNELRLGKACFPNENNVVLSDGEKTQKNKDHRCLL